MALGTFVLVLHAHLPWVLHHGRWPHGEEWLFEAASESWVPLLQALDRLGDDGIAPGWTIGLTPILLEQLAHPRFKEGFAAWLAAQQDRAKADAKALRGDPRAVLAERWRASFADQSRYFRRIKQEIGRRFVKHARAGRIELLSSNATHGYSPLILTERCLRAQIRAGLATSKAHGVRARGVWLPECAYRPDGPWRPVAVHGDLRVRKGIGEMLAAEGVSHFVIDAPTLAKGRPAATIGANHRWKRLTATPHGLPSASGTRWDDPRWCAPEEPHRVSERGRVLPITALARAKEVAEQVWSAQHGYPGDPRYLEFHKREGQGGHRYWRVTGSGVDLGAKEVYDPDAAAAAVRDHADHFVRVVRGRIAGHLAASGHAAIVTAPFDAELFGHWWHEGPAFLEAVARILHDHPEIAAKTASEALRDQPAERAVALAEGSWGAGADHRVWLDDRVKHWWDVQVHAEERFLRAIDTAPWQRDAEVRGWMEDAARELLLLQASDWAFVVTTRGATDYGLMRIGEHTARFGEMLDAIDDLAAGRTIDPVSVASRHLVAATDRPFPHLDLHWWA